MKQKRHLDRGEIREGKGLAGEPCRQQRQPECQCPSKLDLGGVQGLANSPTLTCTSWLPLPLVDSQNAEEEEITPTITPVYRVGPGTWSTSSLSHFIDEKTKAQGVRYLACSQTARKSQLDSHRSI